MLKDAEYKIANLIAAAQRAARYAAGTFATEQMINEAQAELREAERAILRELEDAAKLLAALEAT